jgi:uncharacterized protein YbaR (Trm112 family)
LEKLPVGILLYDQKSKEIIIANNEFRKMYKIDDGIPKEKIYELLEKS